MSVYRTPCVLEFCSRLLRFLLLLAVAGLAGTARADAPPVAVLYPDIREPYRGVFLQIIHGIEEKLGTATRQLPLTEENSLGTLRHRLEAENAKAIIALGRGGLFAATQLHTKLPVIVGAVLISASPAMAEFSGISLCPDPEVLFEWLKTLAPSVKRITVVYNRENSRETIERAREAAKRHGFTLNTLPAENIRQAAGLYRNFLDKLAGDSEALWLPQDDAVLDESALLPVILKEAWDKNLVVFSSTPEHVKKGVLFSLYPDNVAMGRSLAAIALESLREGRRETLGIRPLQDLLIAVNLRTAEHLGLKATSHEKRKFDLVFPSQ